MPRERSHDFQGDPIVIDPPGFDVEASWRATQAYVDRMHAAGRDFAAAAGADPGICSCPKCRVMYWAFGRRQRCRKCGFEYPTDAWPMYSWGVQASQRPDLAYRHEERLGHPYYRYGFEHPVEEAFEEFDRIDWQSVMVDNREGPNAPAPD